MNYKKLHEKASLGEETDRQAWEEVWETQKRFRVWILLLAHPTWISDILYKLCNKHPFQLKLVEDVFMLYLTKDDQIMHCNP